MHPYTLVVFAHVAAAAVLVGGSVIAAPAVRAAVRRAGTTEELRAYLRIGRPLSVLNPVASLVVLASGIYLASAAHFWGLGWVQVAAAFWFVNAITASMVVKPAIGVVIAAMAASDSEVVTERVDAVRWSRAWSHGGDILVANDIAMLYLMTVKPGLPASLLAVATANSVVLALGLFARRSRPAVQGGARLRAHSRRPMARPSPADDGTTVPAHRMSSPRPARG